MSDRFYLSSVVSARAIVTGQVGRPMMRGPLTGGPQMSHVDFKKQEESRPVEFKEMFPSPCLFQGNTMSHVTIFFTTMSHVTTPPPKKKKSKNAHVACRF